MSTPVCVANAVADALGVADLDLPLTPAKLSALLGGAEPPPARTAAAAAPSKGRALHGAGEARVAAPPDAVWSALLDTCVLASVIPGCRNVEQVSATHFRADVTLGVGPVKGRYRAEVGLDDLVPPQSATLTGSAVGALGSAVGKGTIQLAGDGAGSTVIRYDYAGEIGGKVAAVGGRLLDGAARIVIRQFFEALACRVGGPSLPAWRLWLDRLMAQIYARLGAQLRRRP